MSPPPRDARPSTKPSEGGDQDLVVDATHVIPRAELSARASRAGGAGGQHVNTSSTRVEVLWDPATSRALNDDERARVITALTARLDAEGRLRVVASDTRSQLQNRQRAEERLAALVARALLVPRARKKTKPSRASKERRLEAKKRDSQKKSDRRARDWE